MSNVTLTIRGYAYEYWTSMSVSRSMEAIADSFSVSVSDKWANVGNARYPMRPGDAISISIDGETVLTGYLDSVSPAVDAQNHTISLQGRSKAADLVDCSVATQADPTKGIDELNQITAFQAIQKVCLEYGIVVVDEVNDSTLIKKFKVQPGETAFEVITRLATQIGALLVSTPDGNIAIVQSKTDRVSTILLLNKDTQNNNVLSMSARFNDAKRYKHYTVKGQQGGVANTTTAKNASQTQATAQDNGVERFRPLIVLAENNSTTELAQKRAQWEAAKRVGEALTVSVVVQGWRDGDGLLWRPNTIVQVESNVIGINADLQIASVTFNKSLSSGSTTSMELKRPDAFLPEPTKPAESEATGQFLKIVG